MMRMALRTCSLGVLGMACCAQAEVELPSVFSDHMVIQRGKPVIVWGKAEPGEPVSATLADQRATATGDPAGRFRLELPAMESAAGAMELVVSGRNQIRVQDVVLGEVWLAGGQSNMRFTLKQSERGEEEAAGANVPELRFFYVPDGASRTPQFSTKSRWVVCSPGNAGGMSAVGYYFGRALVRELKGTVGVIDSSRGWSPAEAWVPMEVLEGNAVTKPIVDRQKQFGGREDELEKAYQADLAAWKLEQRSAQSMATTRPRPKHAWGIDPRLRPAENYKAMIAPLMPFQLGGVIWYQGESNTDRAEQYRTLLPMVIAQWRKGFESPELPWGIVQLANHVNSGVATEVTWAELRDVQAEVSRKVPHTGLAVTVDVGEAHNIHPLNKRAVGERLAGWALGDVYGRAGVPQCPAMKIWRVENGRVRIELENAGSGLAVREGAAGGFTIAGADRVFKPAKAEVDGSALVVWADEVSAPAAVRYLWSDNPAASVFTKEGLPVSPFRTDDWPGVTNGVRTVEWQ